MRRPVRPVPPITSITTFERNSGCSRTRTSNERSRNVSMSSMHHGPRFVLNVREPAWIWVVRRSSEVHLSDLAAVLPRAWKADSAWIDDWDDRNPARGQCGSTALVVQDLCGGSLMCGIVLDRGFGRHVHYWNVLSGDPLDLTWHQFPSPARIVRSESVGRIHLLSTRWFIDRYEALRLRVHVLMST